MGKNLDVPRVCSGFCSPLEVPFSVLFLPYDHRFRPLWIEWAWLSSKQFTTTLVYNSKAIINDNKTILAMIVTSTEQIPGREFSEILGIARGSTVRARHLGRDIFAGLKNLVGGEIEEYTELQAHAREQAMQRMQEDARAMGADAIVNVRLTTAMVMQGAAEILAYGTAVKLK